MINKGVKVTVDYSNGCYNVTGLYRGKVYSINKPIRGIDRDANFKANYSSRLIKNRKSQILRDIRRHIIAEDANFTYSRRAIKDVDTVMYKALQDWDSMNSTHYAIDYLKTVLQSFNSNGENTAEFKEKCKEKRAENLKKAGIDITYNLGMLKTSKKINMFDKIKGMMIAKKQNKVLGVNVNNSFIMNTPIYLEDKNWFKESEDEVIEEFGNDKGENEPKAENNDNPNTWKAHLNQNPNLIEYGNGKADVIDYGVFVIDIC